MIRDDGGRLRMTRGDYGVPLMLHVIEHCQCCGEELEPDDVIRVEILRGGQALFAQEATYADLEEDNGILELLLTPEEASIMPLGLYTFQVLLIRAGEVRNTLLTSILEVIP